MNIPAGWYPDRSNDNAMRYWDGSKWTREFSGGDALDHVPDADEPLNLDQTQLLINLDRRLEQSVTELRAIRNGVIGLFVWLVVIPVIFWLWLGTQ